MRTERRTSPGTRRATASPSEAGSATPPASRGSTSRTTAGRPTRTWSRSTRPARSSVRRLHRRQRTESGRGIAVDATGAAYVAGNTDFTTQATFPDGFGMVGRTSFDNTANGGPYDGWAVKINPIGNDFAYAGFIGGAALDNPYAIAIDAAGAAYVAGESTSPERASRTGTASAPGRPSTRPPTAAATRSWSRSQRRARRPSTPACSAAARGSTPSASRSMRRAPRT